MDNQELNNLLQQLHDEIKNTQAVDKKGNELLRDLDGDIRALIGRSEEIPVQSQPSSVKNLQSALSHFEVTHPELTMLIARLLDFLSNSGI